MQAASPELLPTTRLDADPTRFNVWGDGRFDNTRPLNKRAKTYVLTHGYNSTGGNPGNNFTPNAWLVEMASSIRAKDPTANIIITDWDGRNPVSYAWSPFSVQKVAGELANFLQGNGIKPNNTTLIGHSLGAHISGLASENLGGQVKTVIGLDPAGPIFEALPPSMRLNPNSGKRVVAIHTSRFFGYDLPTGTTDIYVNPNSLFQPGAWNAIENHGYAHRLFNDLLQGQNYGGLNLDFILGRKTGIYTADTYEGTPITKEPNFLPIIASDFWWNFPRGQYVTPERKPVKNAELDRLREQRIEQTKIELDALSAQLINGKINLETWQLEVAKLLRKLHVEQAILARGGADRMRKEDYLAVGRNLKEEYRYLRKLAQDVADGKLTEAEFRARVRLYAGRSRRSYSAMRQQNSKDDGYLYMQRFLDRIAVHCTECIALAAKGTQPIGSLPLPTEQCRCGGNCKCTVKYYRTYQEAG